jgi:hypothetical protein
MCECVEKRTVGTSVSFNCLTLAKLEKFAFPIRTVRLLDHPYIIHQRNACPNSSEKETERQIVTHEKLKKFILR